ncbi:MAG TPA: hypothetical protein VNT81_22575 [Vicinamibacterales bacterium]|nr:hypothetical protein [Vicinamibacterales bacterium]
MAFYCLVGIVTLASLRGLVRWRDGLFGIVVIAAVQDPLRKLVPGAPGYLVLATLPVLLVAVASLMVSTPGWWHRFARAFPKIRRSVLLLVVACLPAAALSAFYGPGSWMLTILGAVSYSTVFLAVLLGFNFLRQPADLRRFLRFYCLVSAIMLSGALAEHFALWPDWEAIGTSALGNAWIRFVPGYQVQMISGFYRSPDVMGWHAAATVMLATILVLTGRVQWRWIWVAVAAIGLIAVMLCGRRKMVYMLPLFASLFVLLTFIGTWRAGRLVRVALVLAVPLAGGLLLFDFLVPEEDTNVVRYYTETANQTLDRLEQHGFQAVLETYRQTGFFGSGLGVATPGSHLLRVDRPFVWQESGPSRVLVELGVLGMVAFLALVTSMLTSAWRVTVWHQRKRSPFATYAAGLLAFFIANAGSLVVSGQILADPAIATFLGLSVGFILALGQPTVLGRSMVSTAIRSSTPARRSRHRFIVPSGQPDVAVASQPR